MTGESSKLEPFQGHKVETQRLKLSGKVDKDQWVADPHEGDTVVWFIGKGHIGNIAHEFIEDGAILVERIKPTDLHVQVSDSDTIAALYSDLTAVEVERRQEATGVATLDFEQAGNAAADAGGEPDGDDEVTRARATKAGKATKKTGKRATKAVARPRKAPAKKK